MIREALRLAWLSFEDWLFPFPQCGDIGKPERIIETPEPEPNTIPEEWPEPVREPEKVPA